MRDAAELAGVGLRTLYQWLDEADFQAELQRQQDAVIAAAVRGLVGELGANHTVMRKLRDSESSAPSLKLRAALEVTHRAYTIAAMRLLQSAALDKQAAEKRAFQDNMGWSDASYTRQPQPRP